ncbi:NIPSNAP family protein [Agarivorans sp. Alg241-V36]|uniref:NIPSNAP family protein n=1 Tax=Agarivorans sp. Alg241-V36 TaxID=2305992 RepID=UPI0013D5BFC3|nr:NIPSNAP family protein [Agarivorans sp. Alg241-V36]
MNVIELREYRIKPGKTRQWLIWMEQEILPYQQSKGVELVNSYTYSDDKGDEWFVWLRKFKDEQSRQAVYSQLYDQWWIDNVRPKVFELIDESSVKVRLLQPAFSDES